jgi:hypothetical protein
MNEEIKKIKEDIIQQAQYYLLKAGGFYPFGSTVNLDGSVSPQSAYVDSDQPDPNEVIKI